MKNVTVWRESVWVMSKTDEEQMMGHIYEQLSWGIVHPKPTATSDPSIFKENH